MNRLQGAALIARPNQYRRIGGAAWVRPAPTPYTAFWLKTAMVIAKDRAYPRAGIRRRQDGSWLLQIWYAPQVLRHDVDELTYGDPLTAFREGQREVHAIRHRRPQAGQLWLRGAALEVRT